MAISYRNYVLMRGYVANEPIHRKTDTYNMLSFQIAFKQFDTNLKKYSPAMYFQTTIFGTKVDKIAQKLKKGDYVQVEGKLHAAKVKEQYYQNIQTNDVLILGSSEDYIETVSTQVQDEDRSIYDDAPPF